MQRCVGVGVVVVVIVVVGIISQYFFPDIDECAVNGLTLCDTELTGRECNNTPGSYLCVCQEGYEFNEQDQQCIGVGQLLSYLQLYT